MVSFRYGLCFVGRSYEGNFGKNGPFTDVEKNSYYKNAVLWAQQNEIVKGMSETILHRMHLLHVNRLRQLCTDIQNLRELMFSSRKVKTFSPIKLLAQFPILRQHRCIGQKSLQYCIGF